MNAKLIRKVNEIAQQVGAAIMAVYRSGGDAGEDSKADGSPLTLAGLAAHRTVVDGLVRLTPETPIFSEAADISYCRACAVANEVGGRVCDLTGSELQYNQADLHNPKFLVLPNDDGALCNLLKIRHFGLPFIH